MSGRDAYLCYTDGSCKAGPGAPGGWGFVVRPPAGPPIEGFGKASGTLAKVMEYRAVAEVLDVLPAGVAAVVFSDNQSLVESLGKQLVNWRANGFARVDPLVRESIEKIDASITAKALRVTFQWVRGHHRNAGNQRADALAAQGAREAKADLERARAAGRR